MADMKEVGRVETRRGFIRGTSQDHPGVIMRSLVFALVAVLALGFVAFSPSPEQAEAESSGQLGFRGFSIRNLDSSVAIDSVRVVIRNEWPATAVLGGANASTHALAGEFSQMATLTDVIGATDVATGATRYVAIGEHVRATHITISVKFVGQAAATNFGYGVHNDILANVDTQLDYINSAQFVVDYDQDNDRAVLLGVPQFRGAYRATTPAGNNFDAPIWDKTKFMHQNNFMAR